MIKNRQTLKKIKNDANNIKKTPINEVKKYLRNHNLIKSGCNAPNEILRKLYENAILSGNVKNVNKENLLHNFLSTDE